MKVLMVTHSVAPAANVGGKRSSFLAREFTRNGLHVSVVTCARRPGAATDASLPVPARTIEARNPLPIPQRDGSMRTRIANKLAETLRPVDQEVFWIRSATRAGLEETAGWRDGLVIGTMPPPSAGIAAARIAARRGLPLVLDYRDPWSAFEWTHKLQGRISRGLASHIEAKCVRQATLVVLNTEHMRQSFLSHFAWFDPDRAVVIPNGFDEFVQLSPDFRETRREIVYAGAIYNDRSIVPVANALQRLQQESPEFAAWKVTVYGEIPTRELDALAAAGLRELVTAHKRIPHAELMQHLASAGILLAVSGEQSGYAIPYKLYDYFAAGRPLLVIASADSAVYDLVTSTGLGRCIEKNDADGLAAALRTLLDPHQPSPDRTVLDTFRWTRLAARYIDELQRTCAGPPESMSLAPQTRRP